MVTVTVAPAGRAVSLAKFSRPPLTVTPVNAVVPPSVTVPAPALVRAAVPVTPPVTASVPFAPTVQVWADETTTGAETVSVTADVPVLRANPAAEVSVRTLPFCGTIV